MTRTSLLSVDRTKNQKSLINVRSSIFYFIFCPSFQQHKHIQMRISYYLLFLLLFFGCTQQPGEQDEISRWESQASNVTIIRDNYGVPHIYGKTDADAVFGLLYAQCEDDFNRMEMNYINAMGRLAETEGINEIYRDLRMKLFIDPVDMQAQYASSPEWLKVLMDAFADGINYYLYTHPEVVPKVITRFEPWMALTFSEGSIGGDIERVLLRNLEAFYGNGSTTQAMASDAILDYLIVDDEPRGSNGIAISPKNTASGNALFLINPHTTFFFRSEVHMVSDEGLNAYGAVTWGQFFVYQGFNDKAGWMHTSSRADVIDEYLETIIENDQGEIFYKYGSEKRKIDVTNLVLPYKNGEFMDSREFTVYHTHHGPVVREQDGKWVSVSLMQRPVDALSQSYLRTKASNFEEFNHVMEYRTNSSNNTVYADADGNIAYYHGNFMPRRDLQFDWTKPVDGSNPATDWQELHPLSEMLILKNPETGWIQNCNSDPFTSAGISSPKREDYPSYMAPDKENFRGVHAQQVLAGKNDFTLELLIEAAYDSYLPGFEKLVPSLMNAYDMTRDETLKQLLEGPVEALRKWDLRWSEPSVPTSLAVYYGQELMRTARADPDFKGSVYTYIVEEVSDNQRMESFKKAIERLQDDFGSWKIPWGDINRYQRINSDIRQPFNDNLPSLPVAFASGRWGSLASFGARTYPGTKRMYGTSGNSFVAFVEFGEKVIAKSILTGGVSGDTASPHFDDQALMYTKGKFKNVNYYREDVEKNAEKTYHPGFE